MKIITEAMVLDKNSKQGSGDYSNNVYYNVQLGEPKDLNGMTVYDTQLIGVPEEVYKNVEVGKINRFGGSFGGLKTKWWKFDKWFGIVENKSK